MRGSWYTELICLERLSFALLSGPGTSQEQLWLFMRHLLALVKPVTFQVQVMNSLVQSQRCTMGDHKRPGEIQSPAGLKGRLKTQLASISKMLAGRGSALDASKFGCGGGGGVGSVGFGTLLLLGFFCLQRRSGHSGEQPRFSCPQYGTGLVRERKVGADGHILSQERPSLCFFSSSFTQSRQGPVCIAALARRVGCCYSAFKPSADQGRKENAHHPGRKGEGRE